MPLPERIEVKLAFMSEDTAKALAVLGLSDPPKEEKRIHFFDAENLALFDRGLILRVRQTVAVKPACAITGNFDLMKFHHWCSRFSVWGQSQ